MSIEALQWVYEDDPPPRKQGPRAVLVVLAWAAKPDGTNAFRSRATIGQRAAMSPRAVGDALKALEDECTIERTGYSSGGGAVVWRLVMDPEERRAKKAARAWRSSNGGPA